MNLRRSIFWAHLCIGVVVGAFIVIMASTGMMLAFRPQIIAWMPDAKGFLKGVEVWHRWFGLQGEWKPAGHVVKTVCNFAFLAMLISGIYLWWPKSWSWPGIKPVLNFIPGLKGKAWDWNRHNVIGLWCAPFLLLISITGAIMSLQSKLSKDAPQAQRQVRKLIKSIHTGEAGGIAGEAAAFTAAGGAVLLVWTGASMALHRLRTGKERSHA